MALTQKIREGIYCISWSNPTYVTVSNIEVNLKEIFQVCKLSYTLVGTVTNLEVELILNQEMEFKPSLESITILASKYGIQQYMQFQGNNKWKTSLNGNPNAYICCGSRGLTFDFVIDVIPKSMIFMNKESKTVLNHLQNLWMKKTLSDVTFECRGKTIKGHSLILSSGSPVFAAMFKHEFQEKEKKVVEIKDIKSNVFEQLLQYMYTGEIDFKCIDAAELMVAADKYEVDSLKEECASYLSQDITVENASRYLVLAHVHNSSILHQATLNFMSKNAKAICSRKDWMEIIKNYPELSFAAMQMMVMG